MNNKEFINFEDIEIGKLYTCGDDALFKVLEKGKDWILVLTYSYNHKVACPWIYSLKEDSFIFEYLYEETEDYLKEIFDNLDYADYNTLKDNG